VNQTGLSSRSPLSQKHDGEFDNYTRARLSSLLILEAEKRRLTLSRKRLKWRSRSLDSPLTSGSGQISLTLVILTRGFDFNLIFQIYNPRMGNKSAHDVSLKVYPVSGFIQNQGIRSDDYSLCGD
jgi:hypothetical protein